MVNMKTKMPTASSVPRCSASQIAPVLHAFTSCCMPASSPSMLSALAISACSVSSVADQFALDRAVIEHEHPVAAADQFVIVGRIEEDRGARIRELAQELVQSPAWCRHRCRASDR